MQVTWTTKEELIEKLRNLSYKELYKRVRTRARKRKIDVPTTKGELVHLLAELMQEYKEKAQSELVPQEPEECDDSSSMLPTPERMMIVQQGAQVLKCGTFGKPHHQFIQLDDVNLTLRCFSPKTKEEELKKPNTVVDLHFVKDVLIGQHTEVFKKHQDQVSSLSSTSFSLILSYDTTLDLACEDNEVFLAFVSIIRYLAIEKKRLNPMRCTTSGSMQGIAGSPFHLQVEPRDSMGILDTSGTAVFSAKLIPRFPKVQALDGDIVVRDGRYEVYFTTTKSGDYLLDVKLKTDQGVEPIKGSPFKATVLPAAADASKCTCSSIAERSVAGVASSFTIYSKDRFGNLSEADEPFSVNIVGPDATSHPVVETVGDKKGTYTCNYTCFRVGNYQLSLTLGDVVIKTHEFTVKHGDAHASQSFHDFMFKRAVCLETLLFQVSAKDAFGNAVARASLNFAVVVDGVRASSNNCSISITDNHDGTCTIQLTFIWSGLHTINLLICEQDIQNSPISITVEPDAQEKERYMKSVLEDQVLAQIQQWALGKRIHTMLNELNLAHLYRETMSTKPPWVPLLLQISNGVKPPVSLPSYLTAHDGPTEVKKVYMKVLLWLHPDKLKTDDMHEQYECTEIFKVVQCAWHDFNV